MFSISHLVQEIPHTQPHTHTHEDGRLGRRQIDDRRRRAKCAERHCGCDTQIGTAAADVSIDRTSGKAELISTYIKSHAANQQSGGRVDRTREASRRGWSPSLALIFGLSDFVFFFVLGRQVASIVLVRKFLVRGCISLTKGI